MPNRYPQTRYLFTFSLLKPRLTRIQVEHKIEAPDHRTAMLLFCGKPDVADLPTEAHGMLIVSYEKIP